MTLQLGKVVDRLRDAAFAADLPDETPETTALALWFTASGTPRAVTRVQHDVPQLDETGMDLLEELVDRRLRGEPLAYLTGRQEFMRLELLSRPGALIPRRETELLASRAIELARRSAGGESPVRVLDLCTGSGNVAIAIAVYAPGCRVWASDLQAEALAVAAANVAMHRLDDRVTLLEGNLFDAVRGHAGVPQRFDLIVCNPPYLSSQKAASMAGEAGGLEPRAAFDGGDFGVSIVFRMLSDAPQFLVSGGWLCFEVGEGQARGLSRRLASNGGYSAIHEIADSNGIPRVLLAQGGA